MASAEPMSSATRAPMPAARACGVLALAALAAAALIAPAYAQEAAVRVRGVIERMDGAVYVIRSRAGDEVRLRLASGATVSAIVPAKLADITAGMYIGVTGRPQADGSQKAMEIHIFAAAQRGAGEGFHAWDLEPQTTMTNAGVEATVAAASGQVLTLKYKDGEQRIVVPDGIPVVAFAPGSVSDLKAGAQIFVAAAKRLPDGTLETARISVGKGIAPPM